MVRVNFIPTAVQAGRVRAARLRRWGVAAAISVVILTAPLIADRVHQARLAKLIDDFAKLDAERTSLRADVRRVTAEAVQAALHLERARALRAKRGWSRLLSMVVTAMPDSCWLEELSTDPPAPAIGAMRTSVRAAPSADEKGVTIDAPRRLRIIGLAGGADEPHAFVANLKELNIFKEVTLAQVRAEPTAGDDVFRFELNCEW